GSTCCCRRCSWRSRRSASRCTSWASTFRAPRSWLRPRSSSPASWWRAAPDRRPRCGRCCSRLPAWCTATPSANRSSAPSPRRSPPTSSAPSSSRGGSPSASRRCLADWRRMRSGRGSPAPPSRASALPSWCSSSSPPADRAMVQDAAGADATVRRIADYASGLSFAALPADAIHACKRRIVDTLGCAVAAFDAEPCRIARALALRSEAADGARVLGTARRALPELAAFANAAMGRYLDGNDCFPGGGGHPSGVIAPVLAAAQLAGVDGAAAIAAIVVGYEVHRALHESLRVMTKGFDHAFYPAVAAAAAAAKVLRLDHART